MENEIRKKIRLFPHADPDMLQLFESEWYHPWYGEGEGK
jgi:hypothetical protein